MSNISNLLDKAKVMHKLSSDYKLALVMGVHQTSLTNYRSGKSLPDELVITKICDLTGDDPDILAAQINAQRAKDASVRALWERIASRLMAAPRHAVAAAIFAVVLGCTALSFPVPGMAALAGVCLLCKQIHRWRSAGLVGGLVVGLIAAAARRLNNARLCHA
jgi:transcriptional regulator with XRE-family HTH domain